MKPACMTLPPAANGAGIRINPTVPGGTAVSGAAGAPGGVQADLVHVPRGKGAVVVAAASPTAPASTGTVSIAASRILAVALADERFNSVPRFRHNDRDLSRYDVEIFDSKGMITIIFLPLPTPGVRHTTVGCPQTGPIAVPYIVNPTTFEVKGGNMVC